MARRAAYGFFAFLLLFLVVAGGPAWAEDVPVRFGAHKDYTRIVFDFPKLTAYKVEETPGGVTVVFTTPMGAAQETRLPARVSGFSAAKPDAETLVVRIGAKGNVKHYRLMRKVIVDIQGAPVQAENTPPEKPAPEKTAQAPVQEKPAPPAKAPEPEKPPAAVEKTATAQAGEAPPPPAVPVAPVAVEKIAVPEEDRTKISLSTVSPAKLAVFSRFGMLWVVMGTEAPGAFEPEVSGPKAGVLGKPKLSKFEGGSAWRYPMPEGYHVEVEKRNLTWNVYLSPATAPVPPKGGGVRVDTDRTSGRSKLVAELAGAGTPVVIEDAAAGDRLHVVPTSRPDARIVDMRRFPDVEILPAEMGMVVRPLREEIETRRLGDTLTVTAPDGIMATSDLVASVVAVSAGGDEESAPRLFDFLNWRRGGMSIFYGNRRKLEAEVAAAQTPEDRSARMLQLAFLYFANNFGHETLGVLRVIEEENEEMPKNPNFIALRGAARAMARQYPEALKDLSNPAIQQHPEVRLWLGYAAAATEQWHMANRSFPRGNNLLLKYPDNISIPLTIYMAESALRLGQTDTANALLGSISAESPDFTPEYAAAVGYLRGESLRQEGKAAAAISVWKPVAHGLNRLYHTKASLALANLMLQEKKLDIKDAINEVDSLRFAWRGDGLEVQILHNLGSLKVQDAQYLSGLKDMQNALKLSDDLLNDSDAIRQDMRRVLSDIFVGGQADKVSPLEAVSIYNEFGAFLPRGDKGITASLNFADYLIRMDLLDRAAVILEDALKSGGVSEAEVPKIGAQLAVAYLIEREPGKALGALDRTDRPSLGAKQTEERGLLRARAQSQLGQSDAAIATLSGLDSENARKLKVDVLWRGRKWAAAAAAMKDMLPPPAKLREEDARLALNVAVALKLAGDAAQLDSFKAGYAAAMQSTKLADAFGVVTRDGGLSSLSDKETLLRISGEVDMFKGFLESYKSAEKSVKEGG